MSASNNGGQPIAQPQPKPASKVSYFRTPPAASSPLPATQPDDPKPDDMAAEHTRKRSWIAKYAPRPGSSGSSKDSLPEASSSSPRWNITVPPTLPEGVASSPSPNSSFPVPLSRSDTIESPNSSRPSTPRRWSSSLLTHSNPKPTPQQLDQQASQLILNALERTSTPQQASSGLKSPDANPRNSGSFSKMALSSMMGSLSALSLSRTPTNISTSNVEDKEKEKEKVEKKEREKEKEKEKETRGRSESKQKQSRSASAAAPADSDASRSRSRARSQSPFTFRRFRHREPSPPPQAIPLTQSDLDLSDSPTSTSAVRPRTAFSDDPESGDETVGETDFETEDEEWSDDEAFDTVTERNTERNAIIEPVAVADGYGGLVGLDGGDVDADVDPDPLGEGVNVVVPPEPYFPSTSFTGASSRGKRNPRRRKSARYQEQLARETSRPIFKRDRCTIIVRQGDPEGKLGTRKSRRYIVASDLSEESRYAVEWGIGTVLRDGDEMLIVTIVENESKVDPAIPNAADRAVKLRSQQERQGLAYILVRQATSLLQRTKLNVTVSCQAWHAKNARHMLLDIVDYNEPTMLIVGSRGLSQLKGILLGSTSHYLIQKCSVPVMVARRRLKRPPKHSAHLATHRVHVSLAEAGIDRVAPKVDEDVQVMRNEMQREDDRREHEHAHAGGEMEEEEEGEEGEEGEEDETQKVAG